MFSFRRNAIARTPWFLSRQAIMAHVDALHTEVIHLRTRVRALETQEPKTAPPNPYAPYAPQLQTSFGHQDVDEAAG